MESTAESLTPVSPVSPLAPWIGGKRLLSPLIAERIALVPHSCYVEPFTGMGGVFFRRGLQPKVEVINDISRDVTNLFRIAQRHHEALCHELRFRLRSRDEFDLMKRTDPDTLTDLERAARFLYLQRTSFSGKVVGQTFGTSTTDAGKVNADKLIQLIKDVHARLAGVTIERLGWRDCIARYDAPHTLFYLDPPYYGCENDYGRDIFAPDDFRRMAAQLASIDGGFLLSLNDVPAVRELFAAFHIETVETTYTIAGGKNGAKAVSEVLIAGGRAEIVKHLTARDGPLFG